MGGYVAELGAARSGDYARADSIAASLSRDWYSLESTVTTAWHSLETSLDKLVPAR